MIASVEAERPGGRRRPRQDRSRATVESLLDAADALVVDGGPEALTTTAVAERAGVAVGTVYRYFDHVDAVIDAVLERYAERFVEELATVLAAGELTRKRDAANTAVALFVDRCREAPGLRALWQLRPGMGEAEASALAGVVTEAIVARGLADADDPGFVREAEIQWAVAEALVRLAFRRDPDGDPVVLDHVTRLFDLDISGRDVIDEVA